MSILLYLRSTASYVFSHYKPFVLQDVKFTHTHKVLRLKIIDNMFDFRSHSAIFGKKIKAITEVKVQQHTAMYGNLLLVITLSIS